MQRTSWPWWLLLFPALSGHEAAPITSSNTMSLSVDRTEPRLSIWYSRTQDPAAEPTDLLALYAANANIRTTSPMRYIYSQSSLWTPNRRAAAEFWLPNHGSDLQLVHLRGSALFTNNLTAASPAAIISVQPLPSNSAAGGNAPSQCRLVFTRRAGEVRVIWRSKTPGSPVVQYGTASGNYSSQQYAAVSTFTAGDMCSAPANSSGFQSPRTINTAVLRGLQHSMTYYYRVGGEAHGFSPEFHFQTPPAAAAATDAAPVRLLAAADLGTFSRDGAELVSPVSLALQSKLLGRLAVPGSVEYALIKAALMATGAVLPAPSSRGRQRRMLQLLADKQQTFHGLLLVGGLSIAGGQAAVWNDFLEQMQPVLTQVPLAATAGDTESGDPLLRAQMFNSSSSGGECGTAYEQLLRMPHMDKYEQHWATSIGPVHLVMLNSDQNLTQGSAQYNFLESDLRSVNRSETPWVIVGLHRPLYTDEPSTQAPDGTAYIALQLRQQLEPLLVEQQVDLVLNGHSSGKYHHSCPVVKGACVGHDDEGGALGPVHVMLGSAGAASPLTAWAVQPGWMEAAVFENSFAQLTASKTNLELKVMSSGTGEQLSRLLLKKPLHWQPDAEAAQSLYANAVAQPEQRGTNTSALVELLQEDVVAAALAAPSDQLRAAFGPDGSLAELLSSMSVADAPTLEGSWQITSQLMQLVMSVMGSSAKKPAAPSSAAAGIHPNNSPTTHPAQEPTSIQAPANSGSVAAGSLAVLAAEQESSHAADGNPTPAAATVARPATAASGASLATKTHAESAPTAAAAAPTKPGVADGPVPAGSSEEGDKQPAPGAAPLPAASSSPTLAPATTGATGTAAVIDSAAADKAANRQDVGLLTPEASQVTDHDARQPVKPSLGSRGAAAAGGAGPAKPAASAAISAAASVAQPQPAAAEAKQSLAAPAKRSMPPRDVAAAGAVQPASAASLAAGKAATAARLSRPADVPGQPHPGPGATAAAGHTPPILAIKAKPAPSPQPPATFAAASKHPLQSSSSGQRAPARKDLSGSAASSAAAPKHKPPATRKVAIKQHVAPMPTPESSSSAAAAAAAPEVQVVELASSDAAGWVLWAPPARRLQQDASPAVYASTKLMAQGLVLRKADGTPASADKVDAFVYHWLLLQGRLNFKGGAGHQRRLVTVERH